MDRNYYNKKASDRIVKIRKMLRISQKDMSGMLGIDSAMLCRYEHCKSPIPAWLYLAIEDMLEKA